MRRSTILRRVLVAFAALVLALGIAACGNNEEAAIRQGVDDMMAVFQNPAENDAAGFVDDATLSELEGYGIDVNEYLTHCFGHLSYEVTNVSVSGDTATVQMSITNANLVDALNAAAQDFADFAQTDEATELYQSDGESALYAKLFEYLYQHLDAEDVTLSTNEATLSLAKDDEGVWQVDSNNPDFYNALYGGADVSAAL